MKSEIIMQMERSGYAVRAVPVEHVGELRDELEARRPLLDDGVYREYLSEFAFSPPESLKSPRSLIVVAMRQSMFNFTFTFKGEPVRVTVPPVYLLGGEDDRSVKECLEKILGAAGYQLVPAVLPKKLLAVRSGLAAYGRNNVTYVDGMGSFHRLTAYYSDMPPGEDTWREPVAMEQCADCGACGRGCPTGAIAPERFLLHAERCIVFHNEHPGGVPFPSWIDQAWHNCLVGCMRCQRVCPENKPYLKQAVEGPAFSEEETALILAGAKKEQMPAALVAKLEGADLLSLLDVMPRNLGALARN